MRPEGIMVPGNMPTAFGFRSRQRRSLLVRRPCESEPKKSRQARVRKPPALVTRMESVSTSTPPVRLVSVSRNTIGTMPCRLPEPSTPAWIVETGVVVRAKAPTTRKAPAWFQPIDTGATDGAGPGRVSLQRLSAMPVTVHVPLSGTSVAVTPVVPAGTVADHRPSVPVIADTPGQAATVQVIVTAAPVIGAPVVASRASPVTPMPPTARPVGTGNGANVIVP